MIPILLSLRHLKKKREELGYCHYHMEKIVLGSHFVCRFLFLPFRLLLAIMDGTGHDGHDLINVGDQSYPILITKKRSEGWEGRKEPQAVRH